MNIHRYILLVLLLCVSCSGDVTASDRDFFGLESACVPVEEGESVVSPGAITVDQSEDLSNLSVRVAETELEYDVFVAVSGLTAGDNVVRQPSMEFLGMPFDPPRPGDWPIAVVVNTSEPGTVVVESVNFTVDGVEYEAPNRFELHVRTTCL